MNILELYQQKLFSETFNNAIIKGVLTIDGYSFDIRIVNGAFYCNGLPINDFLDECMLTENEESEYKEKIKKWIELYNK